MNCLQGGQWLGVKTSGSWAQVLDEVGLFVARCVDGRGLGRGLAAATEGELATAEEGTEDTHGEL